MASQPQMGKSDDKKNEIDNKERIIDFRTASPSELKSYLFQFPSLIDAANKIYNKAICGYSFYELVLESVRLRHMNPGYGMLIKLIGDAETQIIIAHAARCDALRRGNG
jgi:hypothetical protein